MFPTASSLVEDQFAKTPTPTWTRLRRSKIGKNAVPLLDRLVSDCLAVRVEGENGAKYER